MLNKHDLKDYEQLPFDPVVKPKHYMLFPESGIEIRDVLEQLVKKLYKDVWDVRSPYIPESPMFSSDYVQMMQYGMRFMEKNGLEDLKKMQWYLNKLIEAYGEQSKTNLGDSGCGKSCGVYGSCEQSCKSGQQNDGTQTSQVLG
jgi:hypothetical protein